MYQDSLKGLDRPFLTGCQCCFCRNLALRPVFHKCCIERALLGTIWLPKAQANSGHIKPCRTIKQKSPNRTAAPTPGTKSSLNLRILASKKQTTTTKTKTHPDSMPKSGIASPLLRVPKGIPGQRKQQNKPTVSPTRQLPRSIFQLSSESNLI